MVLLPTNSDTDSACTVDTFLKWSSTSVKTSFTSIKRPSISSINLSLSVTFLANIVSEVDCVERGFVDEDLGSYIFFEFGRIGGTNAVTEAVVVLTTGSPISFEESLPSRSLRVKLFNEVPNDSLGVLKGCGRWFPFVGLCSISLS